MVAEGHSVVSCGLPNPCDVREAKKKKKKKTDAELDGLAAGSLQTLEFPKNIGMPEPLPRDEEEKKARFRPAPELLGCTLVDFPAAKFGPRRCDLCGDCFTCYSRDHIGSSDEEAGNGCSWHSAWPKDACGDDDGDEVERFEDDYDALDMLADECSEKMSASRRCSSGLCGNNRRPKKADKRTRAQRQVREKQFRSKTVLKNTGGKSTVKVFVKPDIKRRNAARQERWACAMAAKKENIETKLIALKRTRRGPPPNYFFNADDQTPPGPATQRQPVRHELRETEISQYAASEQEAELLQVLALLQHRDLLPQDYDLLLRLDEKVRKRTLDTERLRSLPTKLLTGADVEDIMRSDFAGAICAVCMDCYYADQVVKWLPCEHVFHSNCIDNWLGNAGCICPLDGLAV